MPQLFVSDEYAHSHPPVCLRRHAPPAFAGSGQFAEQGDAQRAVPSPRGGTPGFGRDSASASSGPSPNRALSTIPPRGVSTRRRWHFAAFVAAATVVSCQAKRAEFTAGDEAAIRAISDSALAYIHRAEWSKWAALYADDAIFHPPNGHPIKGRAGI